MNHSQTSPSSAKIWMKCPASVALSVGAIDAPEEFAAEGTVAHHIASECLLKGGEPWRFLGETFKQDGYDITVDWEMVTGAWMFLDAINDVTKTMGGDARMMVESRVSLEALGHPELFGKLDCGFVDGAMLHLFDLKYGKGIWVETRDPQFLYYAAAALLTWGELAAEVSHVTFWVVQPRIDWGPEPMVRKVVMAVDELDRWVHSELIPAAMKGRAQAGKAPADMDYNPSASTCRFCSAKLRCNKAIDAFEMLAETKGTDMDDIKIASLLSKAPLARKMAATIEAEAFRRAMKGREIVDHKIVPGITRRQMKGKEAEAAAVELWGDDAYAPKSLKSLPALEKLPGGKEFAAKHGYKPQGKPSIAHVSDNRPAMRVEHTHVRMLADLDKQGKPA